MLETYRMSNNPSRAIGIMVCLIIVFYSGNKILNSDDYVLSQAHEHQAIKSALEQKESIINSRDVNVNQPPPEITASKSISAAEVSDFKSWSRDRGYVSAEDIAIYQGYDIPTLEKLAGGGDALALDALAAISVKAGDFERAREYYWQSAVAGATTAIGHLALLAEPSSISEMSDSDRREKMIETMSILKLAEIRGDVQTASVVGKGVVASYESKFGTLHFSDDELSRINETAQRMYEDLKSRRNEMGLKDFDNSTPALLNQMYKSK